MKNEDSDKYPIKDGQIRYKKFEIPKSTEMKKVIELLEKELERQNLLHMSNKVEKTKKKDLGDGYKGPPLYPESHLFRDELEDAIALLKIKSGI